MRTALVAAVTLASLTSVASAGTYIGLGVGSEARGSSDRGGIEGSTDGYERSGRLMVGFGILSKVAIEAQASRFDITFDNYGYDATQLAIAGKLSLPIGNNFEFFAKGGLQRTSLTGGNGYQYDSAGTGLLLGGGFEYRLNLGVTSASVFVDYQRSSTSYLNNYGLEFEASSGMWTLGATVSL